MAGETLDLDNIISPYNMAVQISERWVEWSTLRDKKVE